MQPITQADLGISTMWNFRKASNGHDLIKQLTALGFTGVELNYQVREEWLPDILKALADEKCRVLSVHNVFPKVHDQRFDTDSMLLGYLDEDLRRQSVALSKTSIDWACRLRAGAVVFHPTEVPLDPAIYDVPLKKLIASGQTQTDEYLQLREKMVKARDSSPYMAQLMRSLDELAEYVQKNNLPIKLGMENRAMCHQVPVYAELESIMSRFAGSCIGCWLDTGHGIMMAEMGLQALPLSRIVSDNIVGMHIHDARDALDHYAPCTLAPPVLEPFMPYIVNSPIKILELSGRLPEGEIRLGTQSFIQRYNSHLTQ